MFLLVLLAANGCLYYTRHTPNEVEAAIRNATRTDATPDGRHVVDSACSSPTEARDWEPYRKEPVDSNTWKLIPEWPTIPEDVDVRSLAGRYQLTMVRQLSSGPDVVTGGSLELVATTSEHRDIGEFRKGIPLIGWTAIDLASFGRISLAHPLDQRDPGRPGIQASYSTEARQLSFSVGNSLELRRGGLVSRTFHAGIHFYVFRTDSTGIVGRWLAGGHSTPELHGYFCALRSRLTPP